MPSCRLCGEELVWREERGKPVPYSMQIHYKSPGHLASLKRNGKKPGRKAEPVDDAVLGLVALGYKAGEARRMLEGTSGDTESRIKAALGEKVRL